MITARERQASLTKPAGSLGQLETIAEQFAAWQDVQKPALDSIIIRVFAADHGVCAQNVSAFPQSVTQQMVSNFLNGGAAISVLSDASKADFAVVNMGLTAAIPDTVLSQHRQRLINIDLAPGTADFSQHSAMTEAQMQKSLAAGQQVIEQAIQQASQQTMSETVPHLFIGGEMGIGNTSAASAIYCTLLDISPTLAVGPGTGIDTAGVQHKANIIQQALDVHAQTLASAPHGSSDNALNALRTVGGLDIAGLVGAYIAAAQQGIPSLVDGFICTAAALVATTINPSVRDWLLFAHQSAEPAHVLALQSLNAQPLLNIGMRLGEGSGAAVALPLLQSAVLLHNNMATFAEASVAQAQT